jgi:polysaccharide chain length determinant protein (PEP-CTERM system associated)
MIMISSSRTYHLEDYLEIVSRRIWYIVIPFVIISIGTLVYATLAPRLYKASTLVLVTPQKVPESFIQSTVTSRIEERLQSISQEVMSRTRLEQVITEFGLYKEESRRMSREEIVALMQKDIAVDLPSKKEEKGFFTIGYIGKDPNIVTTVANRLASLFIEENLKLREQQAVGTTEFLSSELTLTRGKLEQLEKEVVGYKMRHMGELPEQRDTNLKLLEQLQNQYQRVGENLRAAQDRKLFIQKQLSDLELPISTSEPLMTGKGNKLLSSGRSSGSTVETGGTYGSQKESLINQIQDLRARYTDNHPDVIVAKKKLAELETKKETYGVKNDPRYKELNNQLTMSDMDIKRFQKEEASLLAQINRYRARIENMPVREQEVASLLREYQNTKDTYGALLKKSQEAQQSENLERRQKGEQFKVVDPARVPEKPFSPNIPKVLLIGFIASIGCGLGAAFLREQMDRSFHDAGDVEVALGLPVLVTIPRME